MIANNKQLRDLLQEIPKGKVTTYADLGKVLHLHPRSIASLLRKNKFQDIYPCYKVIHSNGKIGGYNLGVQEKIIRILRDGIDIYKGKIDKKFYHNFIYKNS